MASNRVSRPRMAGSRARASLLRRGFRRQALRPRSCHSCGVGSRDGKDARASRREQAGPALRERRAHVRVPCPLRAEPLLPAGAVAALFAAGLQRRAGGLKKRSAARSRSSSPRPETEDRVLSACQGNYLVQTGHTGNRSGDMGNSARASLAVQGGPHDAMGVRPIAATGPPPPRSSRCLRRGRRPAPRRRSSGAKDHRAAPARATGRCAGPGGRPRRWCARPR